MNKTEAKALLDKYLRGEVSDTEKRFIESWYNHAIDQQPIEKEQIDWSELEVRMDARFTQIKTTKKWYRSVRRIAAAAVALFLLTAGLLIYLRSPEQELLSPEMADQLIVPGSHKATLRMADGHTIELSEEQEEIIVQDDISYYPDGSLVANGEYPVAADAHANAPAKLLELHTPAGGQYRITLPDGTKVWLNASSTLFYPHSFSNTTERTVNLNGEAYFEVYPNAHKPFKVVSKGQTIEVLGTHFNVNSYPDEPVMKTTLMEGKVSVSLPSGETRKLIPGRQSLVKEGDQQIHVRNVDPDEAIDWKNGDFAFSNESIETIMRKIGRWYNVDIEFRGKIPPVAFGGVVSRSKNITEVLQLLELTGAVHFRLEETVKGRRIVVMP